MTLPMKRGSNMLKQAWKSYLAALHPRHLRKAYDRGQGFWILYWLVIYPAIIGMGRDIEYQTVIWLTLLRLVPIFIMKWSDLNSKFLMPKAMFLSPMKEEQRREYINDVLLIKIGVSVLCGIGIEIIWSIFNGFHFGRTFIIAMMIFSIGIASYISLDTLGKVDKKIYFIVKDKTDNTKFHWLNSVVIFACIIAIGAIAILEIGAEASLAFACKVFIGATAILMIFMNITIIFGEYKATVALASDYELQFKIEGKVDNVNKYDLFAKKEG